MNFKKLWKKIFKRTKFGTYIQILVISTMFFMSGLHNVDWSQNMMRLNIHMYYLTGQVDKDTFTDQSISGKMWTYPKAYEYGIGMMVVGALLMGLSLYKIGRRIGDKEL